MAEEEKKSKDGKGQGGCCGCCIGCSVVFALLIAFLLGFYIVPKLRDNGWSWDVFGREFRSFRTSLGNKIDDWNYRFIKVKDKVEEVSEKLEDSVENVADKVRDGAEKAEDLVEPLVDDDTEINLIED